MEEMIFERNLELIEDDDLNGDLALTEDREDLFMRIRLAFMLNMTDDARQNLRLLTEIYGKEFNDEERNLFAAFYKEYTLFIDLFDDSTEVEILRRRILRENMSRVRYEAVTICEEVIQIINDYILRTKLPRLKVYFLKVLGDYYRYWAFVASKEKFFDLRMRAEDSYKDALEVADMSLKMYDPIRLSIMLNMSINYYIEPRERVKALQIAMQAISEGKAYVDRDPDIGVVIQLLEENIQNWTSHLEPFEIDEVERLEGARKWHGKDAAVPSPRLYFRICGEVPPGFPPPYLIEAVPPTPHYYRLAHDPNPYFIRTIMPSEDAQAHYARYHHPYLWQDFQYLYEPLYKPEKSEANTEETTSITKMKPEMTKQQTTLVERKDEPKISQQSDRTEHKPESYKKEAVPKKLRDKREVESVGPSKETEIIQVSSSSRPEPVSLGPIGTLHSQRDNLIELKEKEEKEEKEKKEEEYIPSLVPLLGISRRLLQNNDPFEGVLQPLMSTPSTLSVSAEEEEVVTDENNENEYGSVMHVSSPINVPGFNPSRVLPLTDEYDLSDTEGLTGTTDSFGARILAMQKRLDEAKGEVPFIVGSPPHEKRVYPVSKDSTVENEQAKSTHEHKQSRVMPISSSVQEPLTTTEAPAVECSISRSETDVIPRIQPIKKIKSQGQCVATVPTSPPQVNEERDAHTDQKTSMLKDDFSTQESSSSRWKSALAPKISEDYNSEEIPGLFDDDDDDDIALASEKTSDRLTSKMPQDNSSNMLEKINGNNALKSRIKAEGRMTPKMPQYCSEMKQEKRNSSFGKNISRIASSETTLLWEISLGKTSRLLETVAPDTAMRTTRDFASESSSESSRNTTPQLVPRLWRNVSPPTAERKPRSVSPEMAVRRVVWDVDLAMIARLTRSVSPSIVSRRTTEGSSTETTESSSTKTTKSSSTKTTKSSSTKTTESSSTKTTESSSRTSSDMIYDMCQRFPRKTIPNILRRRRRGGLAPKMPPDGSLEGNQEIPQEIPQETPQETPQEINCDNFESTEQSENKLLFTRIPRDENPQTTIIQETIPSTTVLQSEKTTESGLSSEMVQEDYAEICRAMHRNSSDSSRSEDQTEDDFNSRIHEDISPRSDQSLDVSPTNFRSRKRTRGGLLSRMPRRDSPSSPRSRKRVKEGLTTGTSRDDFEMAPEMHCKISTGMSKKTKKSELLPSTFQSSDAKIASGSRGIISCPNIFRPKSGENLDSESFQGGSSLGISRNISPESILKWRRVKRPELNQKKFQDDHLGEVRSVTSDETLGKKYLQSYRRQELSSSPQKRLPKRHRKKLVERKLLRRSFSAPRHGAPWPDVLISLCQESPFFVRKILRDASRLPQEFGRRFLSAHSSAEELYDEAADREFFDPWTPRGLRSMRDTFPITPWNPGREVIVPWISFRWPRRRFEDDRNLMLHPEQRQQVSEDNDEQIQHYIQQLPVTNRESETSSSVSSDILSLFDLMYSDSE
ncbi:unnamed protein product [Thelazia callipaeda]|uniref:14_3_3 domain-containing protein n=1 Tax=Thelazia callipaeda TaxID=103827 RepID=A0A0N5CMC0_THECL|nr:unnamed protein product [Thelazia callipaeda]